MRRIILILLMFLLAPVGAHAQSVLVLVVQPSDRTTESPSWSRGRRQSARPSGTV